MRFFFTFTEPFETDKTIFIGHTPTVDGKPFFSDKYYLVALDTGAGSVGPLALMDIDSLEYWQPEHSTAKRLLQCKSLLQSKRHGKQAVSISRASQSALIGRF